ncbi:MAG: hypothetical protein V4437_00710 [Patescibacteria group bacterium]
MKTILVDAVDTFIIEGAGIFEPMYALLETYSNQKVILTNADDEGIKRYGLDSVPYEVFTLRHNPDKTDSEYFKKMLEHFGWSTKDVIYFEHNPEAVKSAEAVGIVAYYYDKDKKDLESLKIFLDKNL